MSPRAPRLVAASLLAALALAACSPSATMPTPPPGAVVVTAAGTAFVTQTVTAAASVAFDLFLENRDSEAHNVRLWDAAGASVFAGEIFNGPSARVEQVPALAPGTYRISCDIHPEMHAELIAD